MPKKSVSACKVQPSLGVIVKSDSSPVVHHAMVREVISDALPLLSGPSIWYCHGKPGNGGPQSSAGVASETFS